MSKKDREIKTNAMRILDREKIPYEASFHELEGEFTDGAQMADALHLPHEQVYKTLVTVGNDKNHYVFVIPIDKELDLKKCAKAVGVKSVEMIHVKDIFSLTGYVRGGCTSIGMKKQFTTRVDASARQHEQIYVSGGKIGLQLKLSPDDLLRADGGEYADLTQAD